MSNGSRQPSISLKRFAKKWGVTQISNGLVTGKVLCPYCSRALVYELFAEGGAIWKCQYCERQVRKMPSKTNYMHHTPEQCHFKKCPVCTGKNCVFCHGRGWIRL